MERSYLQPVIRNIFGEIPGNSIVPGISYTYFPGGKIPPNEYEFKEETMDEKESGDSIIPKTAVKIANNLEKRQTENQTKEETEQSAKKDQSANIRNVNTIVNVEESPLQSEKMITVNKENEKSTILPCKEPVKKEKVIKKTGFQKLQKETPEKKESEVKLSSSGMLSDSSASLQKNISRDTSSTQLLDSLTFSNNLPQSDNTFTVKSENNISINKVQKGRVDISDITNSENKSLQTESKLDTAKPDKQTQTVIPVTPKHTSDSIDIIPPKKDYLHFEPHQKTQTKLVIGKLTVEVIQQSKEKIPPIASQERIIVHSAPKESNRNQGSGLKIKYGLGQL